MEPGNGASLVLDISCGDFDMLLTGDVEGEGEEALEQRLKKTYDVLKTAHHGSRNSTSESFLQKASPSAALISAGRDNRYGHPHQETVDRLADTYYASVYRGVMGSDEMDQALQDWLN